MPGSDGWTVVLLAAGRGTRMGGPKALMLVGGRPWWSIQQDRLGSLSHLWVASPDTAAQMRGCAGRVVLGDPDAPMFSSVQAGLLELGPEVRGAFILPVDVPAPRRETLLALAAAAGDAVAVPVYQGKRGHPAALSGLWIDRVFDPARREPGQRLDRLIAPELRELAVDDPSVTVNLNTPADLTAWLENRRDRRLA